MKISARQTGKAGDRAVYTQRTRRGELTVRVFARPTLDKWNEMTCAGIAPGFGDDRVRVRALNGFVDGVQRNSTARFYAPQLHSGKRGKGRASTNTAATDGPGSGMMPPGNMERPSLRARLRRLVGQRARHRRRSDRLGAHHHGEGDAHERSEGAALARHPLAGDP